MSPSGASSPVDGAPCKSSHTWQAQTKDQSDPHLDSQTLRGEVDAVSHGDVQGWGLGWVGAQPSPATGQSEGAQILSGKGGDQ